jgi:hypothetical protein
MYNVMPAGPYTTGFQWMPRTLHAITSDINYIVLTGGLNLTTDETMADYWVTSNGAVRPSCSILPG